MSERQAISSFLVKHTPGARASWKRHLLPGVVSIVMPVHNGAGTLASSIRSVQRQTYSNWELVVVDDASTDSSLDIARQFASGDARIRVLTLSENGGVARARNAGIDAARGQYLSFLDSDDLWLDHKLAVQIEFLDSSEAGFCFTSYYRWDGDNDFGVAVPVRREVRYSDLFGGNLIPCLTVLLDRERIEKFFMPEIRHEDYATWLQILRKGVVAHGIPLQLACYRVSPDSLTANKIRSALWTWRILRDQEKLPLPGAGWFFLRYAVRGLMIRNAQKKRVQMAIEKSTEERLIRQEWGGIGSA